MTGPRVSASPRRALATRNAQWARTVARRLQASGVRPNAVSAAGAGFALAAAAAFVLSAQLTDHARAAMLIAGAVGIQLRLLCNLLDGMLAIEGGLQSPTGDIFNEVPDRFADVVLLVGAGYAVPELPAVPIVGWAAAVAAVLTAYIRVLAGSLGLTQHFIGPMAKQHRMFTLTVAAMLAAAEAATGVPARAIPAGLAVIVGGSLITVACRTRRMAAEARAR